MTRLVEIEIEGARATFALLDWAPATTEGIWQSLPADGEIMHGKHTGDAAYFRLRGEHVARMSNVPEVPCSSIYKGYISARVDPSQETIALFISYGLSEFRWAEGRIPVTPVAELVHDGAELFAALARTQREGVKPVRAQRVDGPVPPKIVRHIRIEVEGVVASAELHEDLAPRTTEELWKRLPIETSLGVAQWSGPCCFFSLRGERRWPVLANEHAVCSIYPGTLVTRPGGEALIGYGPAEYRWAVGTDYVTPVARVTEGRPELLAVLSATHERGQSRVRLARREDR